MESKKKGGCLITLLIIVAVFIVLGIIISVFSSGDSNKDSAGVKNKGIEQSGQIDNVDETENVKEEVKKESNTPITENFSTTLGSGHYTSGIDFPSGTYKIVAVNGSGNVSSSNMYDGGLNETMSSTEDDLYIKEFKNAKLEKDVVLSITGNLEVKISSDAAETSTIQTRTNPLKDEVELSSGNYVAGTDFPTGMYDVVLVNGSGNVSSSNMYEGGLNEVLGTGDEMYIKEFKNATFEDGTTLELSGVTIKLVPSK